MIEKISSYLSLHLPILIISFTTSMSATYNVDVHILMLTIYILDVKGVLGISFQMIILYLFYKELLIFFIDSEIALGSFFVKQFLKIEN